MVRRLCFYFFSISDSGETRIAHNKGALVAARILGATGRKMVSECQEEGELALPDGRTVTYNTSTITYDARLGVSLCAFIDAAAGHEPLLNRQIGAMVFCIDFTGTSEVTYCRGGFAKKYSLPPPKDGFLFCPLRTSLSKASLDCLQRISFPKGGLMWALALEHGADLGADWLAKNPPDATWKGKSPTSRRILILSIHRY